MAIATEIANNEVAHVQYLRTALTAAGATPVHYPTLHRADFVLRRVCVPRLTKPSFALQIACPAVSLSPATFTAAANASLVTAYPGASLDRYPGTPDQFNPYQNEDHFYLAAFIFEDVGVTAYKGAIPNLQVGHVFFANPSPACLSHHEELQSAVTAKKQHS